jgi:hypothetical protein
LNREFYDSEKIYRIYALKPMLVTINYNNEKIYQIYAPKPMFVTINATELYVKMLTGCLMKGRAIMNSIIPCGNLKLTKFNLTPFYWVLRVTFIK